MAAKDGGGATRNTYCMARTTADHQGRPVAYYCTKTQHGKSDHQAVTATGTLDWKDPQ